MKKPIWQRTWLWVSIGTFYAVLIAVTGALTSLQETMPWARSAHAYAVVTLRWTLEAAFVSLFPLWPVSIALESISILSRIEDYFRRHRKAKAAAVCLLAAAVAASLYPAEKRFFERDKSGEIEKYGECLDTAHAAGEDDEMACLECAAEYHVPTTCERGNPE